MTVVGNKLLQEKGEGEVPMAEVPRNTRPSNISDNGA